MTSRHLLWTLPNPAATLRCWRAAAPVGRLLIVDSTWGKAADIIERGRVRAGNWLGQLRTGQRVHDGHYDAAMRAALPHTDGITPEAFLDLVITAGWRWPRIERLIDIEWAQTRQLPLADRLLGVHTTYAVTAQ